MLEKRNAYFKSSFQTREVQDGLKVIEGYFIVYNQQTELWQNFFEEIAVDACGESVKTNDIRALYNHDNNIVLGRVSANTLKLVEDEKGILGTITINEQDTEAMNIYHRVSRGDIDGCSFGFYPIEEEEKTLENYGKKIIVTKADVIEVSICPFPQYTQTQISARKRNFEQTQAERLERKRKALKERLKHGYATTCPF